MCAAEMSQCERIAQQWERAPHGRLPRDENPSPDGRAMDPSLMLHAGFLEIVEQPGFDRR